MAERNVTKTQNTPRTRHSLAWMCSKTRTYIDHNYQIDLKHFTPKTREISQMYCWTLGKRQNKSQKYGLLCALIQVMKTKDHGNLGFSRGFLIPLLENSPQWLHPLHPSIPHWALSGSLEECLMSMVSLPQHLQRKWRYEGLTPVFGYGASGKNVLTLPEVSMTAPILEHLTLIPGQWLEPVQKKIAKWMAKKNYICKKLEINWVNIVNTFVCCYYRKFLLYAFADPIAQNASFHTVLIISLISLCCLCLDLQTIIF